MASTVLPNGIIIPEKFSRDWYADLYHNWQELDNLLGGGTPKDGTLTIQKNGSTVGTFSANQATNETVNIEVPTKTSDLNNDSGFITGVSWNDVADKPSFATVATSGSYNDLSNKPAIPSKTSDLTNDSGFITSDNTKIPLAGSNRISGDLIPATTDAVNLGSPSYQWNQAYIKSLTINGVACGDILTHNASEFVNVSSNQVIGGNKAFTGFVIYNPYRVQIKQTSQEIGVVPSSNQWNGIAFTDKNNSNTFSIEQGFMTNGNTMVHFSMVPNIANGSFLRIFESIYIASTAEIVTKSRTLIPDANNSRDLGSSTNKWKSFNGLNPGALSLPSSTYIDVDTTNWDLTCQNTLLGSFTPTADGWLMLHIANSGPSEVNFWVIGGVIRISNKSTLNTFDNNNFNMITIPVEKDVTYNIYGNSSEYVAGRSIRYCRFMPCRGNI